MLRLSENMQVPDLTRKEKKLHAEVAKIYSKNKSFIPEIVKKEKEICASFVVPPHIAKVRATEHDMCFVKREKALNSYNKML